MSKSLLFVTLAAAADDANAKCRAFHMAYPTLKKDWGSRMLSQSSEPPGQERYNEGVRYKHIGETMIESAALRCEGEELKVEAMEFIKSVPDKLPKILSKSIGCDKISNQEELQRLCDICSPVIAELLEKARTYNFQGEAMWRELLERVNPLIDKKKPSSDRAAPIQVWRIYYDLNNAGIKELKAGKEQRDANPGGYRDGESNPGRQEGKKKMRDGEAKKVEAKKCLAAKNLYKDILFEVQALHADLIKSEQDLDEGENLCKSSDQLMESVPTVNQR